MAETNTSNQQVLLQVPSTVKSLIEALIFGARDPLTAREIQAMYEEQGAEGGEPRKIDYDEIARIIEELNGEYTSIDRPYRIVQIAGGYQFATLPAYAEWLGRLYKEQARRKLSQSSIETLAIIAYKQPITKPELESIRGVNCDYVIKTLLEKDLATIVGRASTVGRPLLYGTSKEFLKHFGLNDLNDLPRPREIQEILGDGQFETERRMLEAQQGLGEKKEEEFKSRLPHIPKRKAGLDDDVKILHKKQTREIKVRPADDTEVEKPDELKESTQITEAPESPVILLPQDQDPAFADSGVHDEGAFPIIENGDELEIQAEERENEVDAAHNEIAEPFKYIELTQLSNDATVSDDATSAESQPAEAISTELTQPIDDVTIPEDTSSLESLPAETTSLEAPVNGEPEPPEVDTASEIAMMDNRQDLVLVPEVDNLPVEQQSQKDIEPPIVASAEEKVVEVSAPGDQAGIEEVQKEIIPQVVNPIIEEPPAEIVPSEHLTSFEDEHGQQAHPHLKTRWMSWKEKIQGFIRKLFG